MIQSGSQGLALYHLVRTLQMTLYGYLDDDQGIRYIKENFSLSL